MTTRIFTRDQLDAFGLPRETVTPDKAAEYPEVAVELHREQIDTRRWSSTHSLVFRAPDDGKTYRVTYQSPLTEHQECDDWFDDNEVKAFEVEQRTQIVTRWKRVTDTTMSADVAAHVLWSERKGGWPPSTFPTKLLDTWTSADTENAARLTAAFPEYAAAIALLRSGEQGIQRLRAISGDS
ncbi:hypothetical protein [Streptomyces antibioticus]|uniref:hypothetical protein n=1 Tax=Streptomyces antibioticus TaxID=1890 RepID=UPI0033A88798